jgi:hypothetical protein
VLEVGYVGRRGLHLPQVFDINQPPVAALIENPGINVNYLRPYKGFASIQEEESTATSMYNGLQVAWNRRFSNGFQFGASYTLSKSDDSGSNYRDILPDSYNTSNLWGPSEFDSRNVVVINYLYTLPLFKNSNGAAHKVLGNWQISGSNEWQSGEPCGIGTTSVDYAGVGEQGSFGCGSEGQFWNMNGTPTLLKQFSNSASSPNTWFTTTTSGGAQIFTPPALGTFVLQKGVRDSVYQPGFQDWNAGLFKSFAVTEKSGFQFRAEAFDVNNHPNWSGPGLNPTATTFGKVTSKTGLSRTLQLSLRYYF